MDTNFSEDIQRSCSCYVVINTSTSVQQVLAAANVTVLINATEWRFEYLPIYINTIDVGGGVSDYDPPQNS